MIAGCHWLGLTDGMLMSVPLSAFEAMLVCTGIPAMAMPVRRFLVGLAGYLLIAN